MIHIGIAFDANYINQFFAWSASLKKNNKKEKVQIHAVCNGLSDYELLNIKQWMEQFAGIKFYEIDHDRIADLITINTWPASVYYRLLLPDFIPDSVERLLYMDLDTLVIGDLEELYNIDLKNYPTGAVYDNYVRKQSLINIHNDGDYFNSGVLLIDVRRWNQLQVSSKALEFLRQYPKKIKYVDQCALNAVLSGNWFKLPEKYNLLYSYIPEGLSRSQLEEFIFDKIILHFTIHRPWNMLCRNRLRHLYYHYLKASGKKNIRKYEDFSISKIPTWIKIRLVEWYFDSEILVKVWRKLKNIIKSGPVFSTKINQN